MSYGWCQVIFKWLVICNESQSKWLVICNISEKVRHSKWLVICNLLGVRQSKLVYLNDFEVTSPVQRRSGTWQTCGPRAGSRVGCGRDCPGD